MTFLYPNPVLQMKYSFWRINLHVLCRSGYRSKCKCCTQRWSFLADWKRLMLQKGFSHSFWCTRDTWSFFVLNIFSTNFCELLHRKTSFVTSTSKTVWKIFLKHQSLSVSQKTSPLHTRFTPASVATSAYDIKIYSSKTMFHL